jgi:hypothetical protein
MPHARRRRSGPKATVTAPRLGWASSYHSPSTSQEGCRTIRRLPRARQRLQSRNTWCMPRGPRARSARRAISPARIQADGASFAVLMALYSQAACRASRTRGHEWFGHCDRIDGSAPVRHAGGTLGLSPKGSFRKDV